MTLINVVGGLFYFILQMAYFTVSYISPTGQVGSQHGVEGLLKHILPLHSTNYA